ncbi:MAG: hypothetical protein ABEH43_10970 [Flavobacteriales bacterium]
MPLKLLTSADLHLGRSSTELPSDNSTASTRGIWEKIVELAIKEEVHAILLAGDIVDRNNRYSDHSTSRPR